jgi:hypothetical protein
VVAIWAKGGGWRAPVRRITLTTWTRTVQARLNADAEADLALLRREVRNDSEAVRLALREAAGRRRRRSALRVEAEQAALDRADLTEARRVREEIGPLAAPWPQH